MRKMLVSVLFLSTVLLNAQTRTQGQGVMDEARNESPSALPASAAAQPASDVYVAPPARRISTGVSAPKLIGGPKIVVSTTDFNTADLNAEKVIVRLRVDEKGTAKNVQLIKSVNPSVDARVLEAVRNYHFAPAMLDDQAVPVNLNLVVQFETR